MKASMGNSMRMLLFGACVFCASALAAAQTIGVAILPRTANFTDNSEEAMYLKMGELEEINFIHGAETVEDMFDIINRYGRGSRKIKTLIIGGHGAEPGQQLAGIQLGKDNFNYSHLDTKTQREELATLKEEEKKVREQMKTDVSADLFRRSSHIRQQIKEREPYLQKMDSVGDVMAPGATIWLFNCNALQHNIGRKFAIAIGNTYLSKHGGTIIGSHTNVGLGNFITRFYSKEIPVNADWEKIEIPVGGLHEEMQVQSQPRPGDGPDTHEGSGDGTRGTNENERTNGTNETDAAPTNNP